MTNVAYSAVVLDDSTSEKLKGRFSFKIPSDWEMLCHHMTIKMGELPPELKPMIGMPVKLKIVTFHMNDKVACVQVLPPDDMKGFIKNPYPHITIAVNRSAGGKPVMSNDLLKTDIQGTNASNVADDTRVGEGTFSPFDIFGSIQEVPKS